jgi:hypothetical protein
MREITAQAVNTTPLLNKETPDNKETPKVGGHTLTGIEVRAYIDDVMGKQLHLSTSAGDKDGIFS